MNTFSTLRLLLKRVLNFLENIKNSKLALIGLIILFAVSLVMANGGSYHATKITKLTTEEMKAVDGAYLQSVKSLPSEEEFGRSWYKFETHPLLANIFPQVKFYLLFSSVSLPPTSYFKAEFKGKFYSLPADFNHLILDNNLDINEKTIIDIAKTFTVIASGEMRFTGIPLPEMQKTMEGEWDSRGFPKITFITAIKIRNFKEAKNINKSYKKLMVTDFKYRAYLKIKINEEIQEWFFGINPQDTSQFGVVTIGIPSTGRLYLKYGLPPGVRKPKGKSWDTNPKINVDSLFGSVYREKYGDTISYYQIVSINGDSIIGSVRFYLNGFPPDSHNVYIGEIRGHLPYFSNFHITRNLISWQGLQES
jgi:hypothetical protein